MGEYLRSLPWWFSLVLSGIGLLAGLSSVFFARRAVLSSHEAQAGYNRLRAQLSAAYTASLAELEELKAIYRHKISARVDGRTPEGDAAFGRIIAGPER